MSVNLRSDVIGIFFTCGLNFHMWELFQSDIWLLLHACNILIYIDKILHDIFFFRKNNAEKDAWSSL